MFNIVIVSSSINSHIYSVFSQHERFIQTISTIDSIRKYIENSYIILFDTTKVENKYIETIKKQIDYYYDLSNDPLSVQYSCMDKSLGETFSTIKTLEHISQQKLEYNTIVKLTGRYLINSKFSINNFYNKKFTFCTSLEHQKVYHTTCYGTTDLNIYLDVLQKVLNKLVNKQSLNIESALYDILLDDTKLVQLIETCGVDGLVSANGNFYTH